MPVVTDEKWGEEAVDRGREEVSAEDQAHRAAAPPHKVLSLFPVKNMPQNVECYFDSYSAEWKWHAQTNYLPRAAKRLA